MRRKWELLAGISRRLDIPREALPFGFGLSLSGRETLRVQGCRRILACDRERICLSLGRTVLSVTGRDLICTAFEGESITVEGRISALAFEEREEKNEA
jgi:sporulation protein YqfC